MIVVTILIAIVRTLVIWAWFVARPVLGWLLILIGLIGMPMPIINGTIFLVIGLILVGQRNWLVRWGRVHFKLFVRWWAGLPHPLIGSLGRSARRATYQVSIQYGRLDRWLRSHRPRFLTR